MLRERVRRMAVKAADDEARFRFVEADRRELTVLAKVEGAVVYHGRSNMVVTAISARCLRSLTWFLVKWWWRVTWFGLREKLIERALRRDVARRTRRA